jgi:predicted kinase
MNLIDKMFKKRTGKTLVIVRGVPGSGKSTFAREMANKRSPVLEADDFFMVDGKYTFDKNKLGHAHKQCQERAKQFMMDEEPLIFVSNTCTKVSEMKPYTDLADSYGYKVYSVVVENRHGGKDQHNVPKEALERMETNLKNSIKLR